MPEADGRAGPEVIRAGELSLPLTAAALGRVAPMPHLDNTVELALKVWGGEKDPEDVKAELTPPLAHRCKG